MTQIWKRVGIIAAGGTVSSLVPAADGGLWLATGAGLFRKSEGNWHGPVGHRALPYTSALVQAGSTLVVGSHQGSLAYSPDGGQTWYSSHLRQPAEGLTCLIASPAFPHDGTLLAGTGGSGILRTTDGGRNWENSSFGLHDFRVLALATAPRWGRREVVFAGTAHGLYRSPNGGRAWKKLEIGDGAFQAIAVSPNFAQDGIVLAGTESAGVLRSADGGQSWQALDLADSASAINALQFHPDFGTQPLCLAGTDDGCIYRSTDAGQSWNRTFSGPAPILCLAADRDRIYAGLYDAGLLASTDGGQRWAPETGLAVRAFSHLVATATGSLLAWGFLDGTWRSNDGGQTWRRLEALSHWTPVQALAASPAARRPCLLASAPGGLLRSGDDGQTWHKVLDQPATSIKFSPDFDRDGRVWLTTADNRLWTSVDDGQSWTDLAPPQRGPAILLLDALDQTVLVAALNRQTSQLTVWHSADEGQTWQRWLEEEARRSVQASLPTSGDSALLAHGPVCRRRTGDGWQIALEAGDDILRLCPLPGQAGTLALTVGQVFHSPDGQDWLPFDEGLAAPALADLALADNANGQLWAYVLSAGGAIWRRQIAY